MTRTFKNVGTVSLYFRGETCAVGGAIALHHPFDLAQAVCFVASGVLEEVASVVADLPAPSRTQQDHVYVLPTAGAQDETGEE